MGHFLPKMGPADFNLIPDHRGRDFSQPTCDQGSGGAVPSTSMDEPDPRTNTDPWSIRAPARIIGNNLMDQGSVLFPLVDL